LQNIKEGIEGHPASWYSEVFDILFADLDKNAANQMWKKQLKEAPKKSKESHEEEDD
jgi:Lon-like ATP-dependent protease